jgi:hypothetical protein
MPFARGSSTSPEQLPTRDGGEPPPIVPRDRHGRPVPVRVSRDLFAWADAESAPRRGIFPPSRHDVGLAGTLLVAGIAWGAALRFADSLPVDFGFLLFALQFGVGLVFVIGLVYRLLFRGFNVDRVAIVAALVVVGATLGLGSGPTVAPAITVAGTYTYAQTLPAGPPGGGALACEWAKGRWRIGVLTTTAPVGGLPTPHVLTVDFLDRHVELTDGLTSTLLALGDPAVAPPPGETERGPGDRTGAIALDLLQVNLAAGSSAVDEVRGIFRWTCPVPPPG